MDNHKKLGRPKTYFTEEEKIMALRVNSRAWYSTHSDQKKKARNRLYYFQKLEKAIENNDFKTINKINEKKMEFEYPFWIFPMLA